MNLIYLLVDIVSKNGNLLLDVGPEADGTIPPVQMTRLQALGAWLEQNGDAIYGTRPWKRAEGDVRRRPCPLHPERRRSLCDFAGQTEGSNSDHLRSLSPKSARRFRYWGGQAICPGPNKAPTSKSRFLPASRTLRVRVEDRGSCVDGHG